MARTAVKGPLAFTVGSDQNLETYDSSFTLHTGSGAGTIIAQASTDKLTHAFGDTAAYVYRDGTPTYSGDQYAKVALSGVSNPGRYGVAVRVSADTGANADWYAMVVDTNSFPPNRETWLLKCVNNSVTQLSNVVDTWADGDTVELEAVTSGADCVLSLYKNGTLLRSYTDSSSPLTGGKPGIYARSTSSYQMALDDLELGNVTASGPTLSSPIGTVTGKDAATAGATTDTATGTLYAIACSSATPATGAQIEAGLDSGGAAADSSGSVAVSSTGAKTIALTSITENATRYMQLVHKDGGGNYSNVVVSSSFATSTMTYSGTIAAQAGTIGSSFTWTGANPSTLFSGGIGSKTMAENTALLAARGLSVNTSTGVITGTIGGTAGTDVVSLKQTDSSSAGSETPQTEVSNSFNMVFTIGGGAATSVTMSGPTAGTVGVPSTNFSIGANGTITGTITVTPSDSAGGGTFTPTSVAISAGSPTATFTYTAGSAGVKTISVTNNGGISNPSNISFTATAPGSYSLQIGPGYMMAGTTKLVSADGQWSAWQSGNVGTFGAPTLNGTSTSDTNGRWLISGLPTAGTTRVLIKTTSGEFVGYWVGTAA